jgi:hypothetical protein
LRAVFGDFTAGFEPVFEGDLPFVAGALAAPGFARGVLPLPAVVLPDEEGVALVDLFAMSGFDGWLQLVDR